MAISFAGNMWGVFMNIDSYRDIKSTVNQYINWCN